MIAGHPTSCLLWMVTHKQTYLFKERLLKCEPIDLGHFVVDLRERHMDDRTSYSDLHPRVRNSKHSTYYQWCALLTKSLWSHIRHTPFLNTCFLIFLVTLFAALLVSGSEPTFYELIHQDQKTSKSVLVDWLTNLRALWRLVGWSS